MILPPPTPSVILRSYLCFFALVVLGALYSPLLPFIVLPRRIVRAVFHSYLRTSLWLLKVICGVRYEVIRAEPAPQGPVLYASKHQSAWDSVVLPMLLGGPAAIVKRELLLTPIVGWIVWRLQHIAVARKRSAESFLRLSARARERVAAGQSLLVFPEGTRRPPDAGFGFRYERGFTALYQALGVPCVPIALNSGCFWRPRLIRYPGTIKVEILPAIPPGLPRNQLFDAVSLRIETASRELAARAFPAADPGAGKCAEDASDPISDATS
ncbi:lysophospholipid acyltransferase family protein [Bosea sp. (in: a-proteobacteria)]|jgi:1-acyl-sn-glycerol-3-phosphate acyltransferase|uniref:lysophospholipid acyltransferase family protein n=1 Tax=Bosea sp. (in: a-proteobacteria) TaxID=1871050 RepID=UPI003F72DCC1